MRHKLPHYKSKRCTNRRISTHYRRLCSLERNRCTYNGRWCSSVHRSRYHHMDHHYTD